MDCKYESSTGYWSIFCIFVASVGIQTSSNFYLKMHSHEK